LPGPPEKEKLSPSSGKAQLQSDLGFSPRAEAAEVPSANPAGDADSWDSDNEGEVKPGKKDAKAVEVPSSGHVADAVASGWDSDKEEGSKAGKKATEVPSVGPVADAEASGWDSDKEEPGLQEGPAQQEEAAPSGWDDEKEEKTAKKLPLQLCSLVQCQDCGRSFNSESIEKHKRVCKKVFKQKREQFNSAANRLGEFVSNGEMVDNGDKVEKAPEKVPEGPVKGTRATAAPSGFDSDEEGSKSPGQSAARPKTSEGPKGGMALEFDMGDGPRKAMPKALAARLSKKRSKKFVCMDRGAPSPPKKPEPAASGWDSDGDQKAPPTDVCGAPQQRSEAKAFVAARPSAPTAKENAGSQGELGDLLSEVLSAEGSAPFRGSASHAFVPNFHCMGCDHEVLRIDRHVWNDDVAYMFLRNNYPNVMKLRPQLKAQEGACAYCCQCSSRSADSSAALEDVAEGLRWRVVQA